MIVAALLTIIGLAAGIALVETTGLRMGGVIVVPLLAIYTLYSWVSLPLFALAFAVAIVGVGIVTERTLIHGRALLLSSLAIGAIVPAVTTALVARFGSGQLADIAFVSTILPGLAAYNYHQLEPDQRHRDVALSAAVLVGLCGLGTLLVSPRVAALFGSSPLTSVLFSSASDVATLRGAATTGVPETTTVSRGGVLAVVAVGLLGIEAAHARYGLRLGGLIAIPFVAILTLTNWVALPVYLVGVGVLFGATEGIHRLTLVYGRVLLSLALAVSMLYALVIAAVVPIDIAGFQLYFAAMLSGIGAYNLHLVPSSERPSAAALAAGLLTILLGATRIFVPPAETGAMRSLSALHLLLGAVALAAAALAIVELEDRRDLLQRGREEVFGQ